MEENKKYYTPEISEFHVGFEYEYKMNAGWIKCICTEDDTITYPCNIKYYINKSIRVKFLDADDIETCGFKLLYEESKLNDEREVVSAIFQTYQDDTFLDENYIHYTGYNQYKILRKSRTIFWGEIKNLSELKFQLKRLGEK